MKKRYRVSFTLVEIMIVIAIIALVAAIAIPNLLRSKINANETVAQANLAAISSANTSYIGANDSYGTLDDMITADPPYVDSAIGDVAGRQGYIFADPEAPTLTTFMVNAVPIAANKTGVRSFCISDDGVIRFQATGGDIANRATCQALPPTQ